MDNAFQVRAANAQDIESIFALDRAIETAPHWTVADYLSGLSVPEDVPGNGSTSRCLFVAVNKGGVVGFGAGRATALAGEISAELESVAVAESARRSGIGVALCGAVIEWARGRCAVQIELEVRSRSAGPIALYAGLGFAAAGGRKGYYRSPADDAILMRLLLTR